MLILRHASLATVAELFEFKASGFELPPFPGYSNDQWGIKAHNRPWVAKFGRWSTGQRVLEVGGAYSRLPEWLGTTFGVEPWIADDFGRDGGEVDWGRWGDPARLPSQFPSVRYVFERLGAGHSSLPDAHFDRVFTVSTLEHIPYDSRLNVLREMNRCTARGGRQLHAIDIPTPETPIGLALGVAEAARLSSVVARGYRAGIQAWISLFRRSGVRIATPIPSSVHLLDRRTLVESTDVVYRFYPPNERPKPYHPAASLLLVIDDVEQSGD